MPYALCAYNPKSLAQTCFKQIVYKGCNSAGVLQGSHLIKAVALSEA